MQSISSHWGSAIGIEAAWLGKDLSGDVGSSIIGKQSFWVGAQRGLQYIDESAVDFKKQTFIVSPALNESNGGNCIYNREDTNTIENNPMTCSKLINTVLGPDIWTEVPLLYVQDEGAQLQVREFDFSRALDESQCNPDTPTIVSTGPSPTKDYGTYCFNQFANEAGTLTFSPLQVHSPACTDAHWLYRTELSTDSPN